MVVKGGKKVYIFNDELLPWFDIHVIKALNGSQTWLATHNSKAHFESISKKQYIQIIFGWTH